MNTYFVEIVLKDVNNDHSCLLRALHNKARILRVICVEDIKLVRILEVVLVNIARSTSCEIFARIIF